MAKRVCYVIEVKDGDTFDTKKAAGERATLHEFVNDVAKILPFSFKVFVCGFNVKDKDDLYQGLKRKFPPEELLTGKDLCKLLGISFTDIVDTRRADQGDNLKYFVEQLVKIPAVARILKRGVGK